MSTFLLSISKTVIIDFLSSPEVNIFRTIGNRFGKNGPKFVFRFLEKDDVQTFASGILVPKSYIWPVDSQYLLPHTPFVQDAHKAGLQVYASDFSVDGVLTDFPLTASSAIDCFAHFGSNASAQGDNCEVDFPEFTVR